MCRECGGLQKNGVNAVLPGGMAASEWDEVKHLGIGEGRLSCVSVPAIRLLRQCFQVSLGSGVLRSCRLIAAVSAIRQRVRTGGVA